MSESNTYLVVTPFFPSEENFAGSYILDQLVEIRKQTSFNIQIIKVVSFFSLEKDYKFKNFSVKIFKVIDFPFFIFPGVFNSINKIRFRSFLTKKKIKNFKFSHSHVSYPSLYLVEDLKCKKIIQHHGLDVLQLRNGRNRVIKYLQRQFLINNTIKHLNKADINIGVSNLVLQNLRNYKSYQPRKEFVLYNGVDMSKFFKKKVSKQNVFTIGCVANFWKIKDQITLIQVVEKLRRDNYKIKLRLIGSGPTLKSCQEYVSLNNLAEDIYFEKEMPHDKLNDFYNEIDLFVLPSYYEALGCVYLESWATNTPFIGIQGQGISELIPPQEKNKLLAVERSVDSLKEKILGQLHTKSFPFVSKYNIRNTIKDFIINCLR